MNEKLFLVVDGGGSKTEALLADMSGHIVGIGHAAGSNAYTVGKEAAVEHVYDAIRSAIPIDREGDIQAGWLFIPGFSQCLPLSLPFEITVIGDEASAYYGAMGECGGIVVLAGTGSFAISYDETGKMTSVGGWGPNLGDEGSGYDIGRRAICHALREYDMGLSASDLSRTVLAHYQTDDARDLVRAVYKTRCDRQHIAGLCPIVGALAVSGDAAAQNIIDEAAYALCDLAVTLKTRLKMRNASVSLTGGVAGLGEALLRPFRASIQHAGLVFRAAKYPPSVGGILYAYMHTVGRTASKEIAESYYQSYIIMRRL